MYMMSFSRLQQVLTRAFTYHSKTEKNRGFVILVFALVSTMLACLHVRVLWDGVRRQVNVARNYVRLWEGEEQKAPSRLGAASFVQAADLFFMVSRKCDSVFGSCTLVLSASNHQLMRELGLKAAFIWRGAIVRGKRLESCPSCRLSEHRIHCIALQSRSVKIQNASRYRTIVQQDVGMPLFFIIVILPSDMTPAVESARTMYCIPPANHLPCPMSKGLPFSIAGLKDRLEI